MNAPINPYREERPWGDFVEFIKNSPATVKIITVKNGEQLSLQKHKNRDEFWHIIAGTGSVQIGNHAVNVKPGQDYFAPRNTNHRFTGPLTVLEISLGEFDENDIERIEDKYGRAG